MELIQILDLTAKTFIREFELIKLEQKIQDPMEREMFSWNAPWREESLNHYLTTGWSVGLWSNSEKKEFQGYFLAQPLLFYQGLTQVLWVEHISAVSAVASKILLETATKYARDKHLQSVFYTLNTETKEIKTTKR